MTDIRWASGAAALLMCGVLPLAAAEELRDFTKADAGSWKQMYPAAFSPDGRRLVYCLTPDANIGFMGEGVSVQDESRLVVRSIQDDSERRIATGAASLGGCEMKMSVHGRWVGFVRIEGSKAAGAVRNIVLLDLVTLSETPYGDAASFEFSGAASERLILHRAADIAVIEPGQAASSQKNFIIHDARISALSPDGMRLAWADAKGLHVTELSSPHSMALDAAPDAKYAELTWSKDSKALAALKKRADGGPADILAFMRLNTERPRIMRFEAAHWSGFPATSEPVAPLEWRDRNEGLFFNVRRIDPPALKTGAAPPSLTVWHSRDDKLPLKKKMSGASRPSFLSFVSLQDRRFVPLADETLAVVAPHSRARYLLGYDIRPYGRLNPGDGNTTAQRRDYYWVDIRTGRRELLERGLQVDTRWGVRPALSPDGAHVLYQNNESNFVSIDVATRLRHDLTASLLAKFYFEENRTQPWRQLREPDFANGIQAWTADGAYVLMSDHFDVWALPLRGGRAINLTVDGRARNISYQLTMLGQFLQGLPLKDDKPFVSLEQSLYFAALDFDSGRRGLAVRRAGADGLEHLAWDFAAVRYFKAQQAEVYFSYRQTPVESGEFHLLDSHWQPRKRLTDTNPQQKRFKWTPGSRYLSYTTSRGDKRHAALFLPAGYVEGRKYPTVVNLYRQNSVLVHDYNSLLLYPLLQHGYAVLMPDVIPRLNEAGAAALESTVAAVEAAAGIGVTDPGRAGLWGHSYGAWESSYIISATNMFKAAVAYAGQTNFLSEYGLTYGSGDPKGLMHETDQPFLGGPWWEHWDAFVDNSPVYRARDIKTPLLMAHGRNDAAVPFSQAEELFNTLRRLGNDQAVLLEYGGEGHTFGEAAVSDYQQRMLQFFDHFLKGAAAPAWWAEGRSYVAGTTPSAL